MKAQNILEDYYEKNTRNLYKGFLVLLEDLYVDHLTNFHKLEQSLPQKYKPLVRQANYFDDSKLKYLRKKTLDLGNAIIRENQSEIKKFNIQFEFKE